MPLILGQGRTTSASLGHLQPRGIETNDDMTISQKYILQENLKNALLESEEYSFQKKTKSDQCTAVHFSVITRPRTPHNRQRRKMAI